ncbi:hypothetical protein LR48_Vigan01g114700 [Vigna angularis]|uniref:Uncharacterized protein n=1 Tax=Phaseolus angularis TaxID=3914 RepID=A0A0L9TMD0_PHAAN|nr:hypothetical protein LR48_Vigan01g114700 [Vigna angularis]
MASTIQPFAHHCERASKHLASHSASRHLQLDHLRHVLLTFSLERSSLLSASTFSPLRSTRPLDNSCVRASKQPDVRPHPAETNARHSMWTSVQTAAARPRLYIRTLDTQCGRPFNKQTVRHLPSESNARQSVGVRTFKHWAVRFQPLIRTFGLYRSTILQYERSHIRPITSLAPFGFNARHSIVSERPISQSFGLNAQHSIVKERPHDRPRMPLGLHRSVIRILTFGLTCSSFLPFGFASFWSIKFNHSVTFNPHMSNDQEHAL